MDLPDAWRDTSTELSRLMNIMLVDKDPAHRIVFAQSLAQRVGSVLMLDTVALEQLLTKLESEGLAPCATIVLRIFLKYRPHMAEDLKAIGPLPD